MCTVQYYQAFDLRQYHISNWKPISRRVGTQIFGARAPSEAEFD